MKKILLITILLFSLNNVQAMEYSDYTEFGDYTDEYIESNNLTDVKTERRYKYYKLNKVLGDYSEKETIEYPYLDKDDFKYTDYSSYSDDKPSDKEGRIIESKLNYKYKKIKDIVYLRLSSSMADITIKNLKVLYNGEEISYEYPEDININDFTIKKGKQVDLIFKEKVDIRFLTMTFEAIKPTTATSYLTIRSSNIEYNLTQDTYAFSSDRSFNWIGKNSSIFANPDVWEFYYSNTKLSTSSVFKYVDEITLYKYKDILYRSYNLVREYYDDYLLEPYDDYIYKDEDLYKDYYAKRTRTVIPERVSLSTVKPTLLKSDLKTASVLKSDPKIASVVKNSNQNIYYKINKAKILKDNNYTQNYDYINSTYYPVKLQKTMSVKPDNTYKILYIAIPWLLILVILILVLSKLYKKQKRYDKVKAG